MAPCHLPTCSRQRNSLKREKHGSQHFLPPKQKEGTTLMTTSERPGKDGKPPHPAPRGPLTPVPKPCFLLLQGPPACSLGPARYLSCCALVRRKLHGDTGVSVATAASPALSQMPAPQPRLSGRLERWRAFSMVTNTTTPIIGTTASRR